MLTSECCKNMFAKVVVGAAALMGILAIFIPPQYIDYLIQFSKFFEAMIPVLAVGALLKYLCYCPVHCSTKNGSDSNVCSTKK